jgi:hypothetical protein
MPECQKCQSKFPNRVKIDGKFRVLNRRRFCLECSPFNSRNTVDLTKRPRILSEIHFQEPKQCPRCKETLAAKHFYLHTRKNGTIRLSGYCKPCSGEVTLERQRDFKKQAIAYKGGKCQDCGFQGYEGVFDFHHLDPSQKDMDISRYRNKKLNDTIVAELDKCDLLCANCHRIRHAAEKGLIGTPPRN